MQKFTRKVILGIIWNFSFFGSILFLGAGTFRWWRAWVLLGVVLVATLAMMLGVFRDRQDLLRERLKGLVQRGQPITDRVIALFFAVTLGLLMVLIPRDVFHLHLMAPPSPWVAALGMLVYLAGWWIVALSFKANSFAIPVVKYQKERGHVVVDTGVYGIVRHPMYTGVILLMIGMSLWLESYAGALFALVPSAALAVRILFEERFLRRELPGYDAYTERVRYRLVPWVW